MVSERFGLVFMLCLAVAFIVIALLGNPPVLRAEPAPALDRNLVERLIRAEEQQARALERLTEATERRCR